MQLESFRLYRFSLPLEVSLTVKGRKEDARQGCLVAWRAEGQVQGWGEVSPLPGLSRESLEEAIEQVGAVCRTMVGQEVSMDAFWSGNLVPGRELYPSVEFGLETSLLDLFSKKSGLGLATILVDEPSSVVPVAGLLHGDHDAVLERARRLVAEGYSCLKLKVGRKDLQHEVKLVRALRDELPKVVNLRLDANRAWTLADAVWFSCEVGKDRIEFVEEPLQDPRELPEFVGETDVPIALDETVAESGMKLVPRLSNLAAIVIKPTNVGGLRRVCGLAEQCWDAEVTPVISSSFESSVGLLALANLAACVQGADVAAGLGTRDCFQSDTMDPGFIIEKGSVDVAAFGRMLQWVVETGLEEVCHG